MSRPFRVVVHSRHSPYGCSKSHSDLWDKISDAATTKRGVLRSYVVERMYRETGRWHARVRIYPRRRRSAL